MLEGGLKASDEGEAALAVPYRTRVARRLLERRGAGLLHVLTGLRGAGKTRLVHDIANELERLGEKVRYLSLEEPEFAWVRNGCDLFLLVNNMFDFVEGPVFLALDEPSSIPFVSAGIGSLAVEGRFELLVSSSTASILGAAEKECLADRINEEELLPVEGARRRDWNEILVKDVLREPGVPDIRILERVVEQLVNTVGSVQTQRAITASVARASPISKNTPAHCVSALLNTHIIRAVPRFDLFEGARCRKGGVKYSFTDPELRRRTFGRLSPAAEAFDESVAELARQGEVFWVDDMPGVVDFVTMRADRVTGHWRATPEGPVAVTDVDSLFRKRTSGIGS